MRGRALLAGVNIDDLDMRSYVDFIEAVLVEPAVHGGQDIDTTLNSIEKTILEANAETFVAMGRGEEVFETPEWEARAAAMEEVMPPSFIPGDEPEPEPASEPEIDFGEVEIPSFDDFKPSPFVPQDADTEGGGI